MKNTLFPFKTYLPPATDFDVTDGSGTVITLPKYGCMTWIEDQIVNDYYVKAEEKTSLVEAKTEIVSRLLQCRAGIHKDTNGNFQNKKEILVLPDGRPFPMPLVEAVYEFFTVKEAGGWKEEEAEVPLSPKQLEELGETKSEKKK